MANISIAGLGPAFDNLLEDYSLRATEAADAASLKAVKNLVKLTKNNAPVGHRGKFKRSITYKVLAKRLGGTTYVWGAGGKEGRLTHLLVNGHANRDGGRTGGNPFLTDALKTVEEEYIADMKEALSHA